MKSVMLGRLTKDVIWFWDSKEFMEIVCMGHFYTHWEMYPVMKIFVIYISFKYLQVQVQVIQWK